jgi:hypothetical protein
MPFKQAGEMATAKRRRSCAQRRTRSLAGPTPYYGWMSGLGMPEIGRYLAAWLSGPPPANPREGYSPVLTLGFVVDDLKAYHLEATAGDGRPSSRQLGDCYGLGWRVIRCVRCRMGSPNQCRKRKSH